MRLPLQSDLITPWIAETSVTEVLVLDHTDSTNAESRRRDRTGLAILADAQSAGRGRLGRSWQDIPYAGLAVSVLLPVPTANPGWVPLVTGLALRQAVLDATGFAADLKWPNDLLDPGSGRKLAGILCELIPSGIVIGAGLNVDHAEAELPVPTATSLALVLAASGAPIPAREELAGRFLRELAAGHTTLVDGGAAAQRTKADYRAACATLGTAIVVDEGGRRWEGRARDVDDEGRLVVDTAGGRATVSAGDVHHVRPLT